MLCYFFLQYVTNHTDGPFACNVPIGDQIGPKFGMTTDAYINAILDQIRNDKKVAKKLKLLITSAGNPMRYRKSIKRSGLLHFQVVGSVRQAKKAEELGVDGVIASGFEMGGHTHNPPKVIHTLVLVPSVVETVNIPVVASGGICDGKSFVAALSLGAIGVQMGTRFAAAKECDFHKNLKNIIVNAKEYSSTLCPGAYSSLRVISNEGANEVAKKSDEGALSSEELLVLKDKKLVVAEEVGDVEHGLVAAGQVSSRINSIKTVEGIIEDTVREGTEIIKRLNMLCANQATS